MVLGLVACASKTPTRPQDRRFRRRSGCYGNHQQHGGTPADTETTDTAEETTGEERPYYVRDAKGRDRHRPFYTTIGETERQALRDVWTSTIGLQAGFQSDSVGHSGYPYPQ